MAISGSENMRLIDDHLQSSRNTLDNLGQRLNNRNHALHDLRLNIGQEYRQLAKFRLDKVQAEGFQDRLGQAEEAILALLQRRQKRLEDLDQALAQSQTARAQRDRERSDQVTERDRQAQAIEDLLVRTKDRLEETEAYQLQQDRVEQALEMAEKADIKATQAETDRAEKGAPYEADTLFMYLWKRRYQTPDYRAGYLTRSLDNWVARRIDYDHNRANYYMLTEIPVRLRAHAEVLMDKAETQEKALQEMENDAARAAGMTDLQTAWDAAQKSINGIDEEIAKSDLDHQQLTDQQAQLQSWTDENSQKAVDLQVAELEQTEIVNLYRQAQATPSPDDDVIVATLNKLRQDQQRLAEEIKQIQSEHRQHKETVSGLEKLRQQYRQSGYDSHNSTFSGSFMLSVLLAQLLKGSLSSDGLWGEIQRNQKFRRSRRPKARRRRTKTSNWGGFGGGFGGSGGFGSSGGFSSGGSFGGGGFKTGGGF